MVNFLSAQNKVSIAGVYSMGSSSPEGGGHLFVLENGRYAIVFFGGLQVGDWKLDKGIVKFTPHVKPNEFELFGRHNNNIGDSLRIFFGGFEATQTFISLGLKENKELIMKRVFNPGSNCFSYPYVHKFNENRKRISFTYMVNNKKRPIVSFNNPQGYNDFVVYFYKKESEKQAFSAKFKNDRLYFEEQEPSIRSPLPTEGEDIEFIREFINKDPNVSEVFYNLSYNNFNESLDSYFFDEQKGAYIDTLNYIAGEEFAKLDDDSFDRMSIIYPFKAMKNYSIEPAEYKVDEKPLFYVTCD